MVSSGVRRASLTEPEKHLNSSLRCGPQDLVLRGWDSAGLRGLETRIPTSVRRDAVAAGPLNTL